MRTRTNCMVVGALLALTSIGRAETLVVPVEASRLIDDGRGANRVLLKLSPIEGIGGMAISRAYLAIASDAGGEVTAPIALQLHPITREWSPASVTWTSGWERAGGDFAEEIYARTVVEPSRLGQEIRIDVEAMVREMRAGTAYYGFVLTAVPYLGTGLRSAEMERFPSLGAARLVVEYEPMPQVRTPEWVR